MNTRLEQAIHTIEELALRSGLRPEGFRERLVSMTSTLPDPDRAVTNLVRFLESGFASSLLNDFQEHNVLLEVFLDLVGQSQYLADILVRNPEYLRWLTVSGEMHLSKRIEVLRREAALVVAPFEKSERKYDALKRLHRREMLRIGARDIVGEADAETVTAELSALADAVVETVFLVAHEELNKRSNSDRSSEMAVIALGKLGGGELNFSSDIDLLFVYEQEGDLPEPVGRMQSLHEYHVRLAEIAIGALTGFTAEGHLYRVDMRLRPDGTSGPLAMSRQAYRTYYESRGASWERQMLIKARPIAGDMKTGRAFMDDIQAFVYPRTSLRAPWEEIAEMKKAIELKHPGETNIKLGAGGIRDIEFLVQGMQLLYGGKDDTLRSEHTARSIQALAQRSLIDLETSKRLLSAYWFLRRVEHRLQLLHGAQIHDLPESDQESAFLARRLGFNDTRTFRTILEKHRNFVRTQFQLMTRGEAQTSSTIPRKHAQADTLASSDRQRVLQLIEQEVATCALPSQLGPRLRSLLASRAHGPALLQAFTKPALRSAISRSLMLSNQLTERFLSEPLLWESLIGSASSLLGSRLPGWSFMLHDNASRYRLYNEARSAVRFLSGKIGATALGLELTALAERIFLERASGAASTLSIDPVAGGLSIFAVGKFGSRELMMGSDLDLVCVYDRKRMSSEKAEKFIFKVVSDLTGQGGSYRVDLRLRPEGKNSPLAVELNFLSEYVRNRAEFWELLAMTRLRFVWGDAHTKVQVARILRRSSQRKFAKTGDYLTNMRRRMSRERGGQRGTNIKVDAGGMSDIEFIAQLGAWMLGRSAARPVRDVLAFAQSKRILRREESKQLHEAIVFLRSAESIVRLNSPAGNSVITDDENSLNTLSAAAGFKNRKTFEAYLRKVMKTTRKIFVSSMKRANRKTVAK